jgi:hypothetical protein
VVRRRFHPDIPRSTVHPNRPVRFRKVTRSNERMGTIGRTPAVNHARRRFLARNPGARRRSETARAQR